MPSFQFKQFRIEQDRCAMKVGTDGVLLGAWCHLDFKPESILDIGAGTGLIALMMAQRSAAEIIDAVEIDPQAYEQCVDNFENSDWGDRLFCYHADWQSFAQEMDEKYALIVSNPPFFEAPNKALGISAERQQARFTDSLSYENLLEGVDQLLHPKGQFATILPYSVKDRFIDLAAQHQLFPHYLTEVKGHENAAFKRALIQFGREPQPVLQTQLVIEKERHQYTEAYINLTQDFYLKM